MKHRTGVASLLTPYAIWNLVVLHFSSPQETFDTYRYLGGAIFDFQNPGIATTLLYGIFIEPETQARAQVLAFTLAWGLLALAILHRLSYSRVGWVLATLTLVMSLTPPIWSWNTILGSESLTITACVLTLAAIVWSAGSPSASAIWAVVLTSTLAVVTRPQLVIVLAPVSVVLIIWWARRTLRWRAACLAVLGLLPLATFAAIRLLQLNSIGLSRFRYALNNLVGKETSFRVYALDRMPPCDAVTTALNGDAPWNDGQALEHTLMNQCPETYIWFHSGSVSLPSWVAADAGAAVANFLSDSHDLLQPWFSDARAIPEMWTSWIPQEGAAWWWLLGSLAVGVLLARAAHVRVRVTGPAVLAWVVVVGALATFLFAMWGSDGYDIERHLVPVTTLLPVAALILPATLPGTRGPRAPASQPAREDDVPARASADN